jgi:hypothetical protein
MKKQKITMRELKKWRHWRYENTALLIVSFVLVFYLAQTPLLDNVIKTAGELSYLGAFIVGMFFVSTFTVAPAIVILYHLADTTLHPVEVAILAGLGAMIGDYVIFRFMKDRVFEELGPIFKKLQHPGVRDLFKSPFFAWLGPLFGAFLIASPLPDEVGVSLLGLTKIKRWQFFVMTFTLNSIGILLTVLAARLI